MRTLHFFFIPIRILHSYFEYFSTVERYYLGVYLYSTNDFCYDDCFQFTIIVFNNTRHFTFSWNPYSTTFFPPIQLDDDVANELLSHFRTFSVIRTIVIIIVKIFLWWQNVIKSRINFTTRRKTCHAWESVLWKYKV